MFKRIATISIAAAAVATTVPVSAQAEKPQLACERGPLTKTYGKSQWLVYSCSDDRTLVFISAPGNPAFPFYFSYFPEKGGYSLAGEGTGRKEATAATYKDLKALSKREIEALIVQTKMKSK